MRRARQIGALLALSAMMIGLFPVATAAAVFATTGFQTQWQADEARIANYWGPLSTAQGGLLEPYKGATSGTICPPATAQACPAILILDKRTAQYFDKGRMEQNTPRGPVTSGLLATEMVRGKIQTGDTTFEDRTPPNIPIAGDTDNPSPTYLQLATTASSLLAPAQQKNGGFVTVFISDQGQAEDGGGFAGISMTPPIAGYDAPTQHNVLGVFGEFRDRAGFLTIGNAISEPFRATVKVGGQGETVLVQIFERRVLTYTNSNPDLFKVEMGNIGQHYFAWRYAGGSPTSTTGLDATPTARATALGFFDALRANQDVNAYFSPAVKNYYKGKDVSQEIGLTTPFGAAVIQCERDTVLQVDSPSVHDLVVEVKTGSDFRRLIVRMQSTTAPWLIQAILSQAPSGGPIPASYCMAP